MADEVLQAEDVEGIEVGAPEMVWSQVWQMPVLLLGVALLAVGVYFALPKYVPLDYDKELSAIESLVTKNRLEEAEQRLVTLGATSKFADSVPDTSEGFYWQLYGDLRFKQIDARVWQGITTEAGQENLSQIIEHYVKAQKLGREMPSIALWRYAQALAAMGNDTGALQVVDQMPEDSVTRRHEIVRALVERAMQTDPDPASEKVANLLRRFELELANEPDVAERRKGKIWAMQQRAERLLRANDEQGVIQMLVEGGLMRLKQSGASDLDIAPLNVLLGEAYAMEENFADARLRFSAARSHLEKSGHAMFPRVLVGFADIELAQSEQGYIDRAFGLYHQAYREAPLGPSSILAKIGEAHTEAYREDRFPEALEAFELAASRLANIQAPVWDPSRQKLEHYLGVHIEREFESQSYQNALALLKVIEPLAQREDSAVLAHQFAETYRHLGEQSERMAKNLEPDASRPEDDPHLDARRIHHQEAAVFFEQAAGAYLREAKLLESETEGHGEALWAAGEHFAKAQLWDQAVSVYQDFLATRGDTNKREEARFRLGQAFLADGDYGPARDQLLGLIEVSDTSQWAMQSYVPLSRALVALDEWDDAEQWLRFVVEDHRSIGPDSPYFRDALIELGKLYYRRGSQDSAYYSRGIEVLGEEGGAVERYCTDGRPGYLAKMEPTLRYMLADCLRLGALGLGEVAAQTPNESERLAVQKDRVRWLRDAQMYYNQVQELLDARHVNSLSRLERVYHRNSYFYQADCAFERSDFAAAIPLYEDAAIRWQDHPSSLVALVQIVNCASEMRDYDHARVAHRRAVEVFAKLDDAVFDHPDSLMTRQRWDDWLRWSTELDLYPADTATAGVDTGN